MMNCSHSGAGWCLECVGKINQDNIRLRARLRALRELLTPEQRGKLELTTGEAEFEADCECEAINRLQAALASVLHKAGWSERAANCLVFDVAYLGRCEIPDVPVKV